MRRDWPWAVVAVVAWLVLAGGRLYLRHGQHLYAYDVRTQAEPGASKP